MTWVVLAGAWSGALIATWLIYRRAGRLFFRNDDWFYMERMAALSEGSGPGHLLKDAIPHGRRKIIRHFHPISLAMLVAKYRWLGVNFPAHVRVSLAMHLACSAVCGAIVFGRTANPAAALLATSMVAGCGALADMMFWPGQAAFLAVSLLTLVALGLHPNLEPTGTPGLIALLAVNALAPFVFELGSVTVLVSAAAFLIPGRCDATWAWALLPCLLAPVALRVAAGEAPTPTRFVGWRRLALNAATGLLKTTYAVCGGRFELAVSDTLYLHRPTLDARAAFALPLAFVLASGAVSGKSTAYLAAVLASTALIPFVMFSLAIDESNPNPGLPHQMPRYLYLPATLTSILLGLGAAELAIGPMAALTVACVLLALGAREAARQQALLEPLTSELRADVDAVSNGATLSRSGFHPRTSDYRLDWCFNQRSVEAFLAIRGRR